MFIKIIKIIKIMFDLYKIKIELFSTFVFKICILTSF